MFSYQSPTNPPLSPQKCSEPGLSQDVKQSSVLVLYPQTGSQNPHTASLDQGSSPWFTPLPPQHFFSWTMPNALDFTTLHHYHHLSSPFILRLLPLLIKWQVFRSADKLIHYLIQLISLYFKKASGDNVHNQEYALNLFYISYKM